MRPDRRTSRRTRLGVLAVVVTALAACGGGSGSTSADTAASVAPTTSAAPTSTVAATTTSAAATSTTIDTDPRDRRPYEVERRAMTFEDTSRATTAPTGASVPSRTLPTDVYVPVSDEPVPLIIFSHGYNANPAKFERLFRAWAEAGYAVAAPMFPLTNDKIDPALQSAGDVASQPGDVSFVLDQLLAGELADRFDTSRLAAAGLSLGGLTTYMAAIDEPSRDPRFIAAIVMAAVPPGDSFLPHAMPVLVMHGEFDPVVPIDLALATEAKLQAPTYLVTMLGALHAEAFEDAEENPVFPDRERFHPVVDATTIAFWDTYLLAAPTAAPEIVAAADVPGTATIVPRP